MDAIAPADASAVPTLRERSGFPIASSGTSRTSSPTGTRGHAAYDELDAKIAEYAALQGTLAQGAEQLLAALQPSDDIGQLDYKVWYFAVAQVRRGSARQRRSTPSGSRCRFCSPRLAQASAWFNPELLRDPARHGAGWMARERGARRLPVRDRGPLPPAGARARREGRAPAVAVEPLLVGAHDAYAALSTADLKHPTITLSNGAEVTLTYGQYRAILATNRDQRDRAAAFAAFHALFERQRQYLRVALQRRAAARLVPRPGARLPLDARRGAPRQQHSAPRWSRT